MGVQLCLYHPPGCEGEHRRRGTQGQTRALLDGPVQDSGSRYCSTAETPDGSLLASNLPNLDLPSDLPGSHARLRVAIEHCKPRTNPHDSGDMPTYLPAGLTRHEVNNFSEVLPSTMSLKTMFRPLKRLEVEQITGH